MSDYNNGSSCGDRIGRFFLIFLIVVCMRACRAVMREANRPASSSRYSVVEPSSGTAWGATCSFGDLELEPEPPTSPTSAR